VRRTDFRAVKLTGFHHEKRNDASFPWALPDRFAPGCGRACGGSTRRGIDPFWIRKSSIDLGMFFSCFHSAIAMNVGCNFHRLATEQNGGGWLASFVRTSEETVPSVATLSCPWEQGAFFGNGNPPSPIIWPLQLVCLCVLSSLYRRINNHGLSIGWRKSTWNSDFIFHFWIRNAVICKLAKA
jgi:hypothetical protein